MAEVAGLTFRFQYDATDILGLFMGRLPPDAQARMKRVVEPALMKRDRDLEDAITRALVCNCGSH